MNQSFEILKNALLTKFPAASWAPVFYQGAIAGHEVLTYNNKKIYVCKKVLITGNSATAGASNVAIDLYDEANAAFMYLFDMNIVWNTTGAAINTQKKGVSYEDFYFSRLTAGSYTHFVFTGYKLTLP